MEETVLINNVNLIAQDDMVVRASKDFKFEKETFGYWDKACKQAAKDLFGYVVDAGAYTGVYSIFAAQTGSQVVAFEPNKIVRERFKENVNKNFLKTPIELYDFALSNTHGKCIFTGKLTTKLTSAGKISPYKNNFVDSELSYEVEKVTLDNLIDNVYYDLKLYAIKIDVEGYELPVLQGSRKNIVEHKPLVIAEFLNEEAKSVIIYFMKEIGYNHYVVCDERNLVFEYKDNS